MTEEYLDFDKMFRGKIIKSIWTDRNDSPRIITITTEDGFKLRFGATIDYNAEIDVDKITT